MDILQLKAAPRAARTPAAVSWRSQRRLAVHAPDSAQAIFTAEDWTLYRQALHTVRALDVPYALGGGLAVSFYCGLWRPSKDLDLYVLPQDAPRVSQALLDSGLADYFDRKPYDRSWIFRATRGDAIVDVIWALANGAGSVERRWLTGGGRAQLDGEELPLLAPEEILWSKLHVLQRDRCDWPDLLNLLYAAGPQLHWARVLHLLAGDERLLGGLLMTFSWLAPRRAQQLPDWLWPRLGISAPAAPAALMRDEDRIRLLDTRDWFTPAAPG